MEGPETFIAGETEERKLVPTDEPQPPETIGGTESWITVKEGDHDDFYVKFLRHFYMPFLVGYSGRILVGWIVIFIICVIFGPAFLTSTRSNLDLPKGTPSAEAVDAFVTNYPSTSSWPRAFVVAHNEIPGRGVLTDATKKIYAALNTYKAKYPNTIGNIGGYYNYKAIGLISLANREVSGDNQTIICSVDFQKTATLGDIYTVADDLLDWTKSVSTPAESFYTVSMREIVFRCLLLSPNNTHPCPLPTVNRAPAASIRPESFLFSMRCRSRPPSTSPSSTRSCYPYASLFWASRSTRTDTWESPSLI